jgi:hypothetical protein
MKRIPEKSMNRIPEQSRAELVPSNAPKRHREEEDASAFPAPCLDT